MKAPRKVPTQSVDIARVLEEAARLFAEHGFDGVGIRQIAAQSGVTMPTILYHFGSKLSLYEEVLDLRYTQYREMVLRAIRPLSDSRQKIERITGTLFDLQMRDRTFVMLMHRDIIDVVANKERVAFHKEYAHFLALAAELLGRILNEPTAEQVAFSYVAMIAGFCEMTAMAAASEGGDRDATWYAQKRSELIAASNKILSITR
jgi:AcrR family transcriptional regulator